MVWRTFLLALSPLTMDLQPRSDRMRTANRFSGGHDTTGTSVLQRHDVLLATVGRQWSRGVPPADLGRAHLRASSAARQTDGSFVTLSQLKQDESSNGLANVSFVHFAFSQLCTCQLFSPFCPPRLCQIGETY